MHGVAIAPEPAARLRAALPVLRPPAALASAAAGLTALLALAWLVWGDRTPDLAAQVYRSAFFSQHGFAVWDDQWFAGHHVPGYSLVFPPLGSLVGARVAGAVAGIAEAAAFGWLAAEHLGRRAPAATAWFCLSVLGELMIGRLTFVLGCVFALCALIALGHRRALGAGLLAVVSSAASPVAGLFLVMAALAVAWAGPHPLRRACAAVAVGALGTAVALSILFPEGGAEPFPPLAALLLIVLAGGLAWALEPQARVLRAGIALYVLGTLAALAIPTPMGSNTTRPVALLAGPLLIGATRLRGWRPLILAAAPLAVYMAFGPIREAAKDDAATTAAYYAPVLRFLAARAPGPVRVEVPVTRSHWESALLAPRVPLARGWEGQLDVSYDHLFYRGTLQPAAFRAWLDGLGVRFVALPDVPLAPSSKQERTLLGRGLPWLPLVQRTAHWKIYEVLGSPGLQVGPGRLTRLGPLGFTLDARGAGSIAVRVRFTPYWRVAAGRGCVSRTGDGYTAVRVPGPETVRVSASFTLGRIGARSASCRGI